MCKKVLDELNEKEKDKIVMCLCKNEGERRLFIHRFDTEMTDVTKEGWWDTFTLSMKECKYGYNLCKIIKFKEDNQGYLNMIVEPLKYLGEFVDEDSLAWSYLFRSQKFSENYKFTKKEKMNIELLESLYVDKYGLNCIERAEYILNSFLDGKISLDEIEFALKEPSELEKFSVGLNENLDFHKKNYPLLVKKLPKENMYRENVYTTERTMEYVRDKLEDYDRLRLGNETCILGRVEEVLKYYEKLQLNKKEDKRKKRKERKMVDKV